MSFNVNRDIFKNIILKNAGKYYSNRKYIYKIHADYINVSINKKEMFIMSNIELPLGFGMALAQNETAMERFEQLSDDEKEKIIEKTHNVSSRIEMQSLVNDLLKNS